MAPVCQIGDLIITQFCRQLCQERFPSLQCLLLTAIGYSFVLLERHTARACGTVSSQMAVHCSIKVSFVFTLS